MDLLEPKERNGPLIGYHEDPRVKRLPGHPGLDDKGNAGSTGRQGPVGVKNAEGTQDCEEFKD